MCQLAETINQDYRGRSLVVVGLMKGCLFFLADLVRKIKNDVIIDTMYVTSYQDQSSTGNVKILLDLKGDVADRHLLVVDDVLDTGITLHKIKKLLLDKHPASLEFAVLLNKKESHIKSVDVKYCCFDAPSLFFVGYGMDYNGRFRQLPYLGILDDEAIK
ncbi:MAG: hypoxanthine phosphoribosyltransferase [SAR324 cluster bacterium]|nr:hypoxanthine phosphoribosyltransferase [SAR324 cluster bacterium]